MESEEVSQVLPTVLVEKIIAMIPFPFIFKARCLSKSWRDKFLPLSSEGLEERLAAVAFQKEVGEWSKNWKTFSPVLMGTEDFIAYDRASQSWPRLPLSFVPGNLFFQGRKRLIVGGLLYGFRQEQTHSYDLENIIVANILTRCYRQLPPRPTARVTPVLCHKLVIYPALDMYKVILFCENEDEDHPDQYCVQIYDSKSDTWRSKGFGISSEADGPHVAAYHDGVLYMVGVKTPQNLFAFNVEEETLEELTLAFNVNETLRTATLNLLICNLNSLIMITKGRFDGSLYYDTVQVFKIDLGLRQLLRLSQGPPAALNWVTIPFLPPASDNDSIFFYTTDEIGGRVLSYNVNEDAWSWFTVTAFRRTDQCFGSSFHPGLSPFMPV